jgi:hypothetical protein
MMHSTMMSNDNVNSGVDWWLVVGGGGGGGGCSVGGCGGVGNSGDVASPQSFRHVYSIKSVNGYEIIQT